MRSNLLLLLSLLFACSQTRVSEEEIKEDFEEYSYTPNSEQVQVDSISIHIVYSNFKRHNLVVFIHGSPGNWANFEGFFKNDSLVETYDLLAFDRPGYGYSEYGTPFPSISIQASVVSKILSRFNHKNVILVGHSLGGPIAAKVAMVNPELIHGVVLVAPSIDPDLEEDAWYQYLIDSKLGSMLSPTDLWVSNEEIMALKSQLEDMNWSAIQDPVIVIQGTSDRLVPKENADFAKRMVVDSLLDIRMLEGIDHFIPWTNPREIVKALDDLAI